MNHSPSTIVKGNYDQHTPYSRSPDQFASGHCDQWRRALFALSPIHSDRSEGIRACAEARLSVRQLRFDWRAASAFLILWPI